MTWPRSASPDSARCGPISLPTPGGAAPWAIPQVSVVIAMASAPLWSARSTACGDTGTLRPGGTPSGISPILALEVHQLSRAGAGFLPGRARPDAPQARRRWTFPRGRRIPGAWALSSVSAARWHSAPSSTPSAWSAASGRGRTTRARVSRGLVRHRSREVGRGGRRPARCGPRSTCLRSAGALPKPSVKPILHPSQGAIAWHAEFPGGRGRGAGHGLG